MRVLLVEDDIDVAQSLARGLVEAGFAADYFVDAREALSACAVNLPYDVAILDVNLGSELTGFDVCRALRQSQSPTAILMLTARDDVRDRLAGFDAGADDYLSKPFFLDEVLARVRALSRRPVVSAQSGSLGFCGIELEPSARQVTVAGQSMELTRREYDVLELFLRHPRVLLSRDQIHDAIWSYDVDSSSGLVEVYVGRVRRRLLDAGSVATIENVRGVGYRLTASDGSGT